MSTRWFGQGNYDRKHQHCAPLSQDLMSLGQVYAMFDSIKGREWGMLGARHGFESWLRFSVIFAIPVCSLLPVWYHQFGFER